LAKEGVDVAVNSRTPSALEVVSQEIRNLGRRAVLVPGDLISEEAVHAVVNRTLESFGCLDILVNNAGIGHFARVVEFKTEDWDRLWAINLRAMFLCTRAALPSMIQQNHGAIVNISSLAGKNPFAGGSAYCASKAAVLSFSHSLMLEVREHGIRVIAVCPGSVDTDFTGPASSRAAPEKRLAPQDVAQVIIDALQMPERAMVSQIDLRPSNPK